MPRSDRLLALIQALRRRRRPASGKALAAELGISLRTLYRDVAGLQAQGADIVGEPGVGYVLKPGFLLPPLMFSEDEIEALVLGSRWVADRADDRLGAAARNALAKIAAVLPADLRDGLEGSTLLIGPGRPVVGGRRRSRGCAKGDPRRAQARRSAIATAAGRSPNASFGRSRSASSTMPASSSPGASCGGIFAVSAPTGSSKPPRRICATPRAGETWLKAWREAEGIARGAVIATARN